MSLKSVAAMIGLGVGAVVVVVVVVYAVHQARTLDESTVDGGEPVAVSGATTGGTEPGDLVSASTLPQLSPSVAAAGITSARIVYRSTEGDNGQATTVSGTAFVPDGEAPEGGWPVVAFAHGTTGIDESCAPSLSPTLLGTAPTVVLLSGQGYAVVVPDYQGLGSPGTHPYLDARTAGLNVIDGVRALRATFPDVSTRWAALGQSQGGGAAWAANEQAGAYAPELDLVGTSAIAPPADMTGLVTKAARGTLTQDQAPALQLVLESLHRLHPDLDLDDYRRGSVAQNWDVLSACSGPDVSKRDAAVADIGQDDLAPQTPAAAAALTQYLQDWSLPQKKLTAPMSVAFGAKDTFIDPAETSRALRKSCRLGGTIVADLQRSKGHADIDPAPQLAWVEDRFAGKTAPNDCPD